MYVRIALALPCLAIQALAASADDVAQSIVREARQRQLGRWEGVDAFLVEKTLAGNRVTEVYERVDVEGADGKIYPFFRPYRGDAAGTGSLGRRLTPEELEAFAEATEMTGEAQAKGIEDGLEEAGLPRGLLAASGSDPTATFDPRVMAGANARFLRGAAEGERRNAAEMERDARESAAQMAEFERKARLVGMEKVDGRDAFHLKAEGLEHVQQVEGEEFRLQTVSLWLDSTEYVPLRTSMEGIATSRGESRAFTIERHDADYRGIAGSRMYEPFRQVIRIAGVMNAEQRSQLQQAQAQMANLEEQLAGMPPAQREMIMRQMGPQLEMMRGMASGGGYEIVTEVRRIVANPTAQDLRSAVAATAAP